MGFLLENKLAKIILIMIRATLTLINLYFLLKIQSVKIFLTSILLKFSLSFKNFLKHHTRIKNLKLIKITANKFLKAFLDERHWQIADKEEFIDISASK